MANWTFDERFDRRSASTDDRAGQSLNRHWEMWIDDPLVGPHDAIAALAVLTDFAVAKGSPHPVYPAAVCTRISAAGDDDHPLLFLVAAEYAEPAALLEVGGTFRRVDRYRPTDLNNVVIANTAGDRFDDPLPVPEAEGVFRIRRWYAEVSYRQLMGYLNKANAAEALGFDPHELMVTGIDWEREVLAGVEGTRVAWEIQHRPLPSDPAGRAPGQTGGWRPTAVLDVGWNVRQPAPGGGAGFVTVPARSVFGENLAAPVKLNGADGQPLPEGDPPAYRFFTLCGEILFDLIVSQPPDILAAEVVPTGRLLAVTFTQEVVPGGLGSLGFSLTGSAVQYLSGSGTKTLVFGVNPVVLVGTSLTLDYAPGTVRDRLGNALAEVAGVEVVNNSVVPP